jgi:hypothetical protein
MADRVPPSSARGAWEKDAFILARGPRWGGLSGRVDGLTADIVLARCLDGPAA